MYFGHRCGKLCVVLGHTCKARDLADGEHIRCLRGKRLATAVSFGY
jgi:hypothetical protein